MNRSEVFSGVSRKNTEGFGIRSAKWDCYESNFFLLSDFIFLLSLDILLHSLDRNFVKFQTRGMALDCCLGPDNTVFVDIS